MLFHAIAVLSSPPDIITHLLSPPQFFCDVFVVPKMTNAPQNDKYIPLNVTENRWQPSCSLMLYNVGEDTRFGVEPFQSVSLLLGQGHRLSASEGNWPTYSTSVLAVYLICTAWRWISVVDGETSSAGGHCSDLWSTFWPMWRRSAVTLSNFIGKWWLFLLISRFIFHFLLSHRGNVWTSKVNNCTF